MLAFLLCIIGLLMWFIVSIAYTVSLVGNKRKQEYKWWEHIMLAPLAVYIAIWGFFDK